MTQTHLLLRDTGIFVFLFWDMGFLSHLLIAGCDIGVQISVRPYVRSSVRSFVRPSTFTSNSRHQR